MEYYILKELVDDKSSTYQIARTLKTSQTNVRYWLKKYNLKSMKSLTRRPRGAGRDMETRRKQSVISVTKRKKKIKLMAIEYKGGSCVIGVLKLP